MRGLLALMRTHWRIQRRETAYWVMTLGLAVSIVVVYGSLPAGLAAPRLGLVVEDHSPALSGSIQRLAQVEEIVLTQGTKEVELQALGDGGRWAVLVIPNGTVEAMARGETSRVEIVYGDRSPFEATTGRGVLREFVASLNESLSQDGAMAGQLSLEERTIDVRKAFRLLDFLFPGIVGMIIMFGNRWPAGMIVWWRQLGILKRIGSSPVHPLTLELAQLLAYAALSALQVALLVGLARLLFDVEVRGSYIDLAIVIGLGVVAFMGVWYAFAAVMPSTTSFFSFLSLAAFLMMFLGGSAFPIEDVPAWLQPVVKALPLTHLNEALRGVINRGEGLSSVMSELLVLVGWSVLGFGVSMRIFRWGTD